MQRAFDYVIVGGGTAGCVLASELHRQEAGEIVVIEAGSRPIGRRIHTPALYSQAFGSRWDYQLSTSPQASMRGRRIPWPRGKMLGGCSGLNAMIYSRGSPYDFDGWPKGWEYSGLIRHFEAIERRLFDRTDRFDRLSDKRRSSQQQLPELHPLCERFLVAGHQAGYLQLDDRGREARNGVCRYERTQRLGRRQTTFSAFLESTPVKIIENATVERILLQDQTATGVRLRIGNDTFDFFANKAVVLAAGAIHSPLILQASGIGPEGVLKRAGVERKFVLERVGENLQDHLVFPIISAAREIDSLTPIGDRSARVEYARHRTGPLASNIAEVGGFSVLHGTPISNSIPDIQWHFTPTHYLEYPIRREPRNAWTIGVTLLHPRSRGRIYIEPDTPCSATIDPAYFSDPSDMERTKEAILLSKRIADQPALAECRSETIVPSSPCDRSARLEASIRAYSTTLYHPIGTCAMGRPGESVVNANLRVHGADHLYVADASVIPCLPSANPQAVVMMIGHRLASTLTS